MTLHEEVVDRFYSIVGLVPLAPGKLVPKAMERVGEIGRLVNESVLSLVLFVHEVFLSDRVECGN